MTLFRLGITVAKHHPGTKMELNIYYCWFFPENSEWIRAGMHHLGVVRAGNLTGICIWGGMMSAWLGYLIKPCRAIKIIYL